MMLTRIIVAARDFNHFVIVNIYVTVQVPQIFKFL